MKACGAIDSDRRRIGLYFLKPAPALPQRPSISSVKTSSRGFASTPFELWSVKSPFMALLKRPTAAIRRRLFLALNEDDELEATLWEERSRLAPALREARLLWGGRLSKAEESSRCARWS